MPTMLQASGAALASRMALTLAGFVSSLLLPLVLSQTSVGQFFLAQILIAALTIVAQLGLTLSIPALVTAAIAADDLGRARRAAIQVGVLCLGAAVLTGLATLAALPPVLDLLRAQRAADWRMILPVAVAIAPFASLTAVLAELLRATHAYKAAANLAALAGFATPLYLIAALLSGGGSILAVLLAGLAGSILCVGLGAALLMRRMRDWPRVALAPPSLRAIIRQTLPNLFTSLALFALAQFDILLLSAWSGAAEVAIYGVAMRISILLVAPLAIANAALAPIAMELRIRRKLEELQRILRQVAAACALLAVLPYLGLAVLAPWLIGLWNPDYAAAYPLILILGFGQIVHASCGAAGMLLVTGGDQQAAMRMTLTTGALAVALCWLGLAWGGSPGLAAGAALGNILQVASFARRVRSRFGLEPSLLAFLRPASGLGAAE